MPDPRLGIVVEFDDAEANQNIERHEKRLKELEKALQRFQQMGEKTAAQTARQTKAHDQAGQSAATRAKSVNRLRASLAQLNTIAEAANERQREHAEGMKAVTASAIASNRAARGRTQATVGQAQAMQQATATVTAHEKRIDMLYAAINRLDKASQRVVAGTKQTVAAHQAAIGVTRQRARLVALLTTAQKGWVQARKQVAQATQQATAATQQGTKATQQAGQATQQQTQRVQNLQKTLKKLTAVNSVLNQSIANQVKAQQKQETLTPFQKQMRALRRFRWELITTIYFLRIFAQMIKQAYALMVESAETAAERVGIRSLARVYEVDVGLVVEQMRLLSEGALSVQEALALAQSAMLQDQGQFSSEYARLWEAARIAAVTSGAEAEEVFKAFVQSLAAGTGEAIDSVAPLYQVRLALQKYAKAAGTTVEELDPLIASQIILQTVYGRTAELVAAGADEALRATAGTDALAASWENFKATLESPIFQEFTGILAEAVDGIAELVVIAGTVTDIALDSWLLKAARNGFLAGTALGQVAQALRAIGEFGKGYGDSVEKQMTGSKFEQIYRRRAEAMGRFREEIAKTNKEFERFEEPTKTKLPDYDPIVDHLLRREKLIADHQKRLDRIETDYNRSRNTIWRRFHRRQNEVIQDAVRDRGRAWRRYYRRREREIREHNLRLVHEEQDYERRRRQEEMRYRLDRLHDEALYQYERGILVAEGDVLAIEDLDARQALERTSEEENFALKQQQAWINFREERRQTEEQFALQLRTMIEALREQLFEIDQAEQERLTKARQQRLDDLAEARQHWLEQLNAEKESHQESLREWAQHWDKVAKQTQLGSEEIVRLLAQYFGPGGVADSIINAFMVRAQRRIQITIDVEAITGRPGKPRGSSGTAPQQRTDESDFLWSWLSGHQYGGEGIVSRPTMIPVGGGDQGPEHYNVQPLSSIGGNFNLRWQGGAIPIHGSGTMEGIDPGALSNAVAQGLILELQKQLVGYGGV